MFAATTFFRSERMSWRISWRLASLTCSSVMFTPVAADGAACRALSIVVAANTAVAKQNRKAMFFFNIRLNPPFQEYDRAGSKSDTGTFDSVVRSEEHTS